MVAAIPSQIGSEIAQQIVSRELRSFYFDRRISYPLTSHEFELTYDKANNSIILLASGIPKSPAIMVESNRDLILLLATTGPIHMKALVSETNGLVFTGTVKAPSAVRIRIVSDRSLNSGIFSGRGIEAVTLLKKQHPVVRAFTNIDSRRATQILSHRPTLIQYGKVKNVEELPKSQTELVRSVVGSFSGLEKERGMLIPDFSLAMPRPIAPDALPNSIPITQPIAAELGLKAGQVVQALVGGAGNKMSLQLNDREIPLPPGTRLTEGLVQLRVMQGQNGFSLHVQALPAASHGQAAAMSGISAVLAEVIARPVNRLQIANLLAPRTLDSLLENAGFDKQAQQLAGNRLNSTNLNSELIARAVRFGGLNTERALMEGISLSSQTLKPWLRQILRLLPGQSDLSSRIGELIGDIESLQLDATPNNTSREQQGLAALLLFRDQAPVELIFEYKNKVDGLDGHIWVINLHTSIDRLGEVWLKSTFKGSVVDVVIWAEQAQTASLAKKSAIDLRDAFSEIGLTIESLQILNAVRSDFLNKQAPSNINLDVEA